jgi:signal transduction histidine kinase
VLVYVVCVLAWVLVGVLGWNPDWPGLGAFVALYTVARWRSALVSVVSWLVCLAGEVLLWTLPLPHSDTLGSIPGLQSVVPLLLGLAVARWHQQRDEAVAHALQTQRNQTVVAARAAFGERLRIAAEMHDVVAHTLSAIAVQSAVLRHRHSDVPGPDTDAVIAIEEASRTALEDLRRMLHVFDDDHGSGVASLSPTPSLAELDVLVSAHRATHGPIELAVGPGVLELPDSVQLTAFRLVQEALTNVRKHAGGAAARVQVDTDPFGVVVRVDDDGVGEGLVEPGAAHLGAAGSIRGFGLVGMRERVEMFGGSIDAGPVPEGGFRIEARLPVSMQAPASS